ncbi:MAG: bile acid:sodium symporter [Candidatus Thermoplasmatota archaeon]
MFRPWRSFPFMVASGLVVGLATGGFPAYSKQVQQLTLILAMMFSLTEISFRGMSAREEARGFVASFVMTYVVLSGLVLVYAFLSADREVRNGWVLMAAVPPAVAVVPITSLLKGNVRRSLISEALLYLLGLVMVPLVTLAFLGEAVAVNDLVVQTLLLIGVPIALSRPLRRWKRIDETRATAVSVSFFFLVVAIAGSTRDTLFGRPDLIANLAPLAFLRTFGLGIALFGLTYALRTSREARVQALTFASFKNLGLTVVLAFTFFGPVASLPSIVSLIFEILWMSALPLLFRSEADVSGQSPAIRSSK